MEFIENKSILIVLLLVSLWPLYFFLEPIKEYVLKPIFEKEYYRQTDTALNISGAMILILSILPALLFCKIENGYHIHYELCRNIGTVIIFVYIYGSLMVPLFKEIFNEPVDYIEEYKKTESNFIFRYWFLSPVSKVKLRDFSILILLVLLSIFLIRSFIAEFKGEQNFPSENFEIYNSILILLCISMNLYWFCAGSVFTIVVNQILSPIRKFWRRYEFSSLRCFISVDIEKTVYPRYYGDIDYLLRDADCVTLLGTNYRGDRVRMPDEIDRIEVGAFCFNYELRGIYFSDKIKEIGDYAFFYSTNVDGIDLSNCEELESIHCRAFSYCKKLKSISLPCSLKFIGEYAFVKSRNIRNIRIKAIIPPNIVNEFPVFDKNVEDKAYLYVPEDSVQIYKESAYWGRFRNIKPL